MNKTDKELAVEVALAYIAATSGHGPVGIVKPEFVTSIIASTYKTLQSLGK